MNPGKVSQSILKRSVLKCIDQSREEVAVDPAAGEDCAVLRLEDGNDLLFAVSKTAPYPSQMGKYAVTSVVNKIAAQGGVCIGILVHAIFPSRTRELHIKNAMEELESAAAAHHLAVVGGHTELSETVAEPVISLTGIGKAARGTYIRTAAAEAGKDVVMTKWIGLEGTAILAREGKEELLTRLPEAFIEEAKSFESLLSVAAEAATAVKSGVCAMHAVSEGGIFGALWELADCAGVGLSIDLKNIPVRQETIEISEFYHINPYELLSGGSLLLVADHGYELVERLLEEHIPAAVIGRTTDGNDRVIRSRDEFRFLEPPKMDEIYKVTFRKEKSKK
ncbi:MAG: hydrogenase maturation factor [Lachnospiraceae bacterium]|nr:hydrogenase maturation factor [Lachnospiraceae bacterium]